jgi:MFS family permease
VPGATARLTHTFRALRHRNFRLFLGGQLVSLTGTWMQQVALGWLVYRLTRSAFLLGLVGFAGQMPSLLVGPFAGVLADRWNVRRMVIATQAAAMLQALVLASLVLSGVITIQHVLVLSALLGVITAVDVPARQAFLVQMVEGKQDLSSAIALNSSTFNAARLVGPSIAGLLIGFLGEGPIFLANGLSYVAVIGALLAMRLPAGGPAPAARRHVLAHLQEGFRYAFGFAPMRALILLLGLVSLVGVPFTVLLPVFATDVLHGGAHTLGFLVSGMGVGSLVGALYLAGRPSVRGLGRVIAGAVALFGASLVAFAASRNEWLSVAILLVAGFGVMVQMAAGNTILQTIVDDDKRGRVMSLYATAFMGALPLGSLIGGTLASRIGAPATVALGGLGCLAGAAVFARSLPALRAQVRPVYARLGIIPEVATGLQTATEPLSATRSTPPGEANGPASARSGNPDGAERVFPDRGEV